MNWHFNSVAVAAALLSVASCGNSVDGPEGTKTLQTDGIRITWIQDNAKERLMERSLFPDASDSLVASLGLQDGIPSTVSVFLVETDGKKMLFDTGLGLPDSRMLPSLQALGVAPEDIDYLYITHFHGDHIGGMLKDGKPVFPEAQVYVPERNTMPGCPCLRTVKRRWKKRWRHIRTDCIFLRQGRHFPGKFSV